MKPIKPEVFRTKAAALIERNGKFLGVRTKESKFMLPGGRVEKTEEILTALRREVKEELGVKVVSTNFLGCLASAQPYTGDKLRTVGIVFAVKIRGKPRPLAEIVELKWFKGNEKELGKTMRLAINTWKNEF